MRRKHPQEVVRLFGSRMTRATPLEDLLLQLVELLRDRLGVSAAEVWIGTNGHVRRAVAIPHAAPPRGVIMVEDPRVVAAADVRANAWISTWIPELLDSRDDACVRVAPAASNGELHGLLVIVRERDFAAAEERALAELGRLVGMAMRNLTLDTALEDTLDELRQKATDLQLSRARLVAAADDARRGIERDLHDGAQQSLLALGMKVRAARRALDSTPPDQREAIRLLDELESNIDLVSLELRRLAHGVYPPELGSGGLAEALPTLQRGGVPIDVVVPRQRLPGDVEAAVYFCCVEAVQNATKHGGPGVSARIRVEVGDEVTFAVVDDGAGFDATDAEPGLGLANMADRLGALGGQLRVDSYPERGTTVRGTIPLPS